MNSTLVLSSRYMQIDRYRVLNVKNYVLFVKNVKFESTDFCEY